MKVTVVLELPDSKEHAFTKEYLQLKRKLSATGFAVVQRADGKMRTQHGHITFRSSGRPDHNYAVLLVWCSKRHVNKSVPYRVSDRKLHYRCGNHVY